MIEPDSGSRDLVLVTGASGFVGSAIANAARAAGYRVRVLTRASSTRTNISPLDEVAIGDICDRASLVPALRDVRYLIHAAADYRLWSRVPGEIIRTNVEGTRQLMEEAQRAGVERIVHTSSVATIALKNDTPANEGARLSESEAIGTYKKSKVAAERLVENMVDRVRLPAIIVNPSTPIGPRDVKPTPTGRIIVEAARGRMPGFVDTGLNLVHADDVAAGHLLALRRGRIGERYILGGENVFLHDMLAEIARLAGRRPPRLRLPIAPLFPVAFGAEWLARLTGREPFATVDGLRMARHHMFFSDAKARRELGYSSRRWQEGITDAIAWFRQVGYIPRRDGRAS
jgi:dihydroflavonol-4-reductase